MTLKDIKNIYLRVNTQNGHVKISAPSTMDRDEIHVFMISKLDWIKKQQFKFQTQNSVIPYKYVVNENHYVWGQKYLLKIIEINKSPYVEIKNNNIIVYTNPHASAQQKQKIINSWYIEQLKTTVYPLIKKWEPLMDVKVKKLYVRKMKTKWGSCNYTTQSIRLNTELVKKVPTCLEYVLVHEMTHLLEPTHNARFKNLLGTFMPQWKCYKNKLNQK